MEAEDIKEGVTRNGKQGVYHSFAISFRVSECVEF